MNKNQKVIKELIDIYTPIPEPMWIMGYFDDYGNKHCALGHLYALNKYDLDRSLVEIMQRNCSYPLSIMNVNDNNSISINNSGYEHEKASKLFGKGIKERVLTYLTNLYYMMGPI